MGTTIRDLLEMQKRELDRFYQEFDGNHLQGIVDRILATRGNLYFTGVGKSGGMASHTADMLKSLGYHAFYLCPTNCLHGDLGSVRADDLVFLYSKSGNTDELMTMAPYLKKVGAHVVGVFCSQTAKLGRYCHEIVHLPCGRELDRGFNLVPTTSIACYVLFCNLIIGYILHHTQMSLEHYGKNHPSGQIGRSIWQTIEDIIIPLNQLCVIPPSTTLVECMLRMSSTHSGCALITDPEERLLGVLTDGDIRRFLTSHGFDASIEVGEICVRDPETITGLETRVGQLDLTTKKLYPVVDAHGQLLGLVTGN